jgi:lipopolysaccharide transport system ATP-binding protein
MQPAIRVENLAKVYRVAQNQQQNYKTFRELLGDTVMAPLRRFRSGGLALAQQTEEFWALKDVSFEVQPGEVVGIIGRNGAGKSTLLKILSRITKPTKGRVEINGRVGSLLEVGTGFHSELTGRENVYLNGSILGMNKREIAKKFDEIVDFAGVDKFLDTPVKRYSSGMYVRLAFAVAAHLEPEILIVDEVLAVGDAEFQKKCLGKIGDVAKSGKTALFVSHNLQAVKLLCTHAIYLRNGKMLFEGTASQAIANYLGSSSHDNAAIRWDESNSPGSDSARLKSVRILNDLGETSNMHDISKIIDVELEFDVLQSNASIDSSIHILNEDGLCVCALGVELERTGADRITKSGTYRTTCRIPANFLNEGRHSISVFLVRNSADVMVEEPALLSFVANDYGNARGEFVGKFIGIVRPKFDWDIKRLGDCG